MHTVDQALALVVEHAHALAPRSVPLSHSLGLMLAEAVTSDIDSPPYDKALMDGYAVRHDDLASGSAQLQVVDEVTAGDTPHRPLRPGEATRIMTGAPLPEGATAVVMVEESQLLPGEPPQVRIQTSPPREGQHILRAAVCMRRGEEVLPRGHVIRPGDVGLLAEVGRSRVLVIPRPQVAVLATGNELVAANQHPRHGQIRNSNGPMLLAMAASAQADTHDLGIGRDDPRALRERILTGLQNDVLVLSGGVSAGKLDLVPLTLEQCGVVPVFHKLLLRPGKPLWFGHHAERNALVFGLPGNPVSSFVCFHLFVRLAIARLAGVGVERPPLKVACLAADFQHRGDRPTWHPAELFEDEGDRTCQPVRWQGSADLRALAKAQCLAHFPAGDRHYRAGEHVEVLPF